MRSCLFVLFLMTGCEPTPPPANPTAPSAQKPLPAIATMAPAASIAAAVTPSVAQLSTLQSKMIAPCLALGNDPKPCELSAIALAPDGRIFVGGGAYLAVEFGGKKYAKRAYEQLVLGAFDPDGKPLWSKAMGVQWHNKVDTLNVINEKLVVTGVHANGFGHKLPDLKRPPGHEFEAETSFVAVYQLDGTLLWIKNLAAIVTGKDAAGFHPRTDPRPAKANDGMWMMVGTDDARRVVHIDLTGHMSSSHPVNRAKLGDVAINGEGKIVTLDTDVARRAQVLTTFDENGAARDLVLSVPIASRAERIFFADDGTIHLIFGETSQMGMAYRYIQINAEGRTTVDSEIAAAPTTTSGGFASYTQAMTPTEHGLRIAFFHDRALRAGGQTIDARRDHVHITLVDIDERGRVQRVQSGAKEDECASPHALTSATLIASGSRSWLLATPGQGAGCTSFSNVLGAAFATDAISK